MAAWSSLDGGRCGHLGVHSLFEAGRRLDDSCVVEREDLGHGVFTYYLLEGLRGSADTDHDGIITVDEAYGYVSRKVPEVTGQNQHPVKKGEVEGQLVLGQVK